MLKVVQIACCALCAFVLSAVPCNAELIDRGSGLIYDSLLNVTWLQDADYIQTSGAAPFGRLSWGEAVAWADGLQYVDTVRGVVWDDWRLPSTVNNMSSTGFDVSGQSSELASLYYLSLGFAPNFGDQSSPEPQSNNYNPFINLIYRGYWSGTTVPENPAQAWYLHFHFGYQSTAGGDSMKVWAVRDGDVGAASVPEPGSLALVGLGVVGVGFMRRKSRG